MLRLYDDLAKTSALFTRSRCNNTLIAISKSVHTNTWSPWPPSFRNTTYTGCSSTGRTTLTLPIRGSSRLGMYSFLRGNILLLCYPNLCRDAQGREEEEEEEEEAVGTGYIVSHGWRVERVGSTDTLNGP